MPYDGGLREDLYNDICIMNSYLGRSVIRSVCFIVKELFKRCTLLDNTGIELKELILIQRISVGMEELCQYLQVQVSLLSHQ